MEIHIIDKFYGLKIERVFTCPPDTYLYEISIWYYCCCVLQQLNCDVSPFTTANYVLKVQICQSNKIKLSHMLFLTGVKNNCSSPVQSLCNRVVMNVQHPHPCLANNISGWCMRRAFLFTIFPNYFNKIAIFGVLPYGKDI